MRFFKYFAMFFLLGATWCVHLLHLGVFIPPLLNAASFSLNPQKGEWIDKSIFGMHQLILHGSPYERGLDSGKLTRDLLYQEEKELVQKLRQFIPSTVVLAALELLAMRWFWGLDAYLEPWMTEEMYGVSKSAPKEFNSYADPFTRQIAYHGIHEVGQMAVDQGAEDMGCTVVALPYRNGFLIGRNFDFEVSRTFDSEKILKWVFPDKGYAFVSVIWAGMVGAVTGVNEHGVYLSMNAAGSTDFRRLGTPSTLVLVKALQQSKNAEEAVQIIRDATMFITDIFVVADRNKVFRVEKSPRHIEVHAITGAGIVTNHLIGKTWSEDAFNIFRRDELTSTKREQRGEELVKSFGPTINLSANDTEELVLRVLRDKGEYNGKPLTLGNRQAIDALIAAHSVIYNAPDGVFYVSNGPGVSGPFTGFDLRSSFASKTPNRTRVLSSDPLVSEQMFLNVRNAAHEVAQAEKLLAKGQCDESWITLETAGEKFSDFSAYHAALGNYYECKKVPMKARAAWRRALELSPAYPKHAKMLKEKIQS